MTDETNGSGVGERGCPRCGLHAAAIRAGVLCDPPHGSSHVLPLVPATPDADDASERPWMRTGPEVERLLKQERADLLREEASTDASGAEVDLAEAIATAWGAHEPTAEDCGEVSMVCSNPAHLTAAITPLLAARESAAATRARAEERERIASAIEAAAARNRDRHPATWSVDGESRFALTYDYAARIARGDA